MSQPAYYGNLGRDEYDDLPWASHHLHDSDKKVDWRRDPDPVYVPVVDRETGEVLR